MTEREAFVAAIAANPAEDTPRLAFADWLQENGEDDRAAFVRLACAVAARRRELGDPSWPLPDDVEKLRDRANELFELRGEFWLEAFYRSLGCEETGPLPARGWAGRLWRRVAGEPRFSRHLLENNSGDEFQFGVGGNGAVREVNLYRGLAECVSVNFRTSFEIPDFGAALRLEPVHRLSFHFDTNPPLWRSMDRPELSRVSQLMLWTPDTHTRRRAAAFADLAFSENWSGLRDLTVWCPRAEGSVVPHGFVHQLANAPLLAGLRALSTDVSVADLPLLTTSPHARNLCEFRVWSGNLPSDAAETICGAVFRSKLETLDLSLNELSDAGARRLATASWPELRKLSLNCNGITDDGVRDLLPLARQLTNLSLLSGQITDAGARPLADALNPDTLEYFGLSYNPLSEGLVAELRERFGARFQFTAHDGPLQQFA